MSLFFVTVVVKRKKRKKTKKEKGKKEYKVILSLSTYRKCSVNKIEKRENKHTDTLSNHAH